MKEKDICWLKRAICLIPQACAQLRESEYKSVADGLTWTLLISRTKSGEIDTIPHHLGNMAVAKPLSDFEFSGGAPSWCSRVRVF